MRDFTFLLVTAKLRHLHVEIHSAADPDGASLPWSFGEGTRWLDGFCYVLLVLVETWGQAIRQSGAFGPAFCPVTGQALCLSLDVGTPPLVRWGECQQYPVVFLPWHQLIALRCQPLVRNRAKHVQVGQMDCHDLGVGGWVNAWSDRLNIHVPSCLPLWS